MVVVVVFDDPESQDDERFILFHCLNAFIIADSRDGLISRKSR